MAVTVIGPLNLVRYTLVVLLLQQICAHAIDPRPGAVAKPSNTATGFGPQPRIVGGSTSPEGRYPYFVSLLNQYGEHNCGGILVAPDVVMTAAHCSNIEFAQVGRWSLKDDLDGYEEFQIEMPFRPHPLYNSGTSFSHDAMLLKLNRQSTKNYIRINDNNDLPSRASSTVRDNLTTMGFGYTKYGNTESKPEYLQEASLSYVPNHICERSKDPKAGDSYQGLISDDMLCASDNGEDACQGELKYLGVIRRIGKSQQHVTH
jgi:trypsin